MKAWFSLYKKEFDDYSFAGLLFIGVIFILQLLFFIFVYRDVLNMMPFEFVDSDDVALALILFYMFLLFLYFVSMIYLGDKIISKDLESNTIYFLLSLPRRGWQIVLAKFSAALSWFILVPLFNIVSTILLSLIFVPGFSFEIVREIVMDLLITDRGLLLELLFFMLIYYGSAILVFFGLQFSYLLSNFFYNNQLKRLVEFTVSFQIIYCLFRLNSGLRLLVDKLGVDLSLSVSSDYFVTSEGALISDKLNLLPIITCFLGVLLLIFGSSLLLEKHLEV